MVVTGTIRDCILDPDRLEEIRELIAEGRTTYGSQTFDQCLMELVNDGSVDFPTAKAAATNPGDFELKMNMLSGRGGGVPAASSATSGMGEMTSGYGF
jgi:twitching motility protein PilT